MPSNIHNPRDWLVTFAAQLETKVDPLVVAQQIRGLIRAMDAEAARPADRPDLDIEGETATLLCSIVNRCGLGGPVATESTLHFVRPEHLEDCVKRAIAARWLTPKGRHRARAWLQRATAN